MLDQLPPSDRQTCRYTQLGMRSPGLRKLIIPASTAPVPLTVSISFSLVQPFVLSHLRHEVAKFTGTVTIGCLAKASKAASGTGVGQESSALACRP